MIELCPNVKRDFHTVTIRRTEMAMVVPDDHPLAERKSADFLAYSVLRVEGVTLALVVARSTPQNR